MRKLKALAVTILSCALLAGGISALAADAQVVTTWSFIWTGISAEFEAGHKGTGNWGTDTSRVIRRSWVAVQDGANASPDIVYSARVGINDVGRYKASNEHLNNPTIVQYKYYGWEY